MHLSPAPFILVQPFSHSMLTLRFTHITPIQFPYKRVAAFIVEWFLLCICCQKYRLFPYFANYILNFCEHLYIDLSIVKYFSIFKNYIYLFLCGGVHMCLSILYLEVRGELAGVVLSLPACGSQSLLRFSAWQQVPSCSKSFSLVLLLFHQGRYLCGMNSLHGRNCQVVY